MSNQKSGRSFGGKGYYIALVLCAAAIGISGYVFYHNTTGQPEDTQVLATDPTTDVQLARPDQTTEEMVPTQTDKATIPTAGKLSVCMPVQGQIISEYAMEVLSYNQTTRDWRTHNGIDIAAEAGSSVVAAADGEVYTVYEDDRMGMTVVIRHDGGYVTKYASLGENVLVSPGDPVTMGQTIGSVGATALMESALGDHVHFSVTKDDADVDPETFLNQ